MQIGPTIDFSKYSEEELLASLRSINREKFEQNYLACRAEVEKRKANGSWKINQEKAKAETLFKIRKVVRILSLIQAFGGIAGIMSYGYMYGPFILRGQITVITLAIVMAVTVIFGLTSFVAWKYWKTERDWKGLWKILIGLQIPAFSISGLSYEFYSGLKFQIGVGIKQTVNAMLGSNFLLVWNPHNTVFQFALNIGALILLVLLIKLEDMKRAADFSEN